MVVRTDVLWQVGLFDPVFGSYYEDYDFCRRASDAGWKIGACPQARVLYYQDSATNSPEARLQRERWILRNRAIYEARLAGDRRAAYLLSHLALDFPMRALRSAIGTPSSQSLRAVLDANLSLVRLLPRLASKRRDSARWKSDLRAMQWPGVSDPTEGKAPAG
jgi:GT2 family glycosyltransferase